MEGVLKKKEDVECKFVTPASLHIYPHTCSNIENISNVMLMRCSDKINFVLATMVIIILIFTDKKKSFKGKTMNLAEFLSSGGAPDPLPTKPTRAGNQVPTGGPLTRDSKSHGHFNKKMGKYNMILR